jgi:hypothetical protein
MMQQAPMAPRAVQSPAPGTEKGGANEYFKMVARIPSMDDEELKTYIGTGYGALALSEVARRNRSRMVEEAQKAGLMQGQGTIAEGQIAQLMQNRMRERMASDDRFGLNNIVAQAEQGGLEFGQPAAPVTLAGGGPVAFQEGGRSFLEEMYGRYQAIPNQNLTPTRPVLQSQATSGPIVGRQATQADVRRVDNAIEQKAAAATEKPTKTEKKEAQDVVAGLKSLTAKDILKAEKDLMSAEGIGAFGAGAKELIGKRRQRGEQAYERAMSSEPFLAAAQAVGGGAKPRRMGKTEALAAAMTGAAASASGINRERVKFQEGIDDLNQKLALQEELYNRGRVSDAMKLERDIRSEQAKLALERQKLASLAQYRQDMIRAQPGKGGVKPGDVVGAMKEIRELESVLYMNQNISPEQQKAIQQRIRMLQGLAGAGVSRGMGISIEDVAD